MHRDTIFDLEGVNAIGSVERVDTGTVVVAVESDDKLRLIQVNQLVVVQSALLQHHIIGLVSRIARDSFEEVNDDGDQIQAVRDSIKVILIGTLIDKVGTQRNVFRRSITAVPQISAKAFSLEGTNLTAFMKSVASASGSDKNSLDMGAYTLDDQATAYIDGNALFARHAAIVGSTGSGKSWTVARLVEQVAELPMANAILFDLHGEYASLKGDGITRIRVAGPADTAETEDAIFLPYWLLSYDEMGSLLLDRSDQNAPNQAMLLSREVTKQRRAGAEDGEAELLTVDSPSPYDINLVRSELERLDTEMVPGARSEKQGPFNGKLTRFIQRLAAKTNDKRMNFMFGESCTKSETGDLEALVSTLMSATAQGKPGVKVVDLAEVPSDVLPIVVGMLARLIFTVQMWMDEESRVPIALFCDEAHLYLPNSASADSAERRSVYNFERIAKEGRKYGVALVVISQRPSEINHTILSQCGNFISMRLSNNDDQNVVKKLLPDTLAGLTDLLPVLDIGEALAVGDACLLPSRVRVHPPTMKPISTTKRFWDLWSGEAMPSGFSNAITALRRQSKDR